MEYKFSALSSNKIDLYEVVVFEIAGQVGISCDCPAIVLCKHRIALITGKTDIIFPSELNEPQDIKAALDVIKNSDIPNKYNTLNAELENIRQEFKKQEKGFRRKLSMICVPKI